MKIKVLSWNIWIDGNLEKVKEFLKESDADIICLQEVVPSESGNPVDFLSSLGYNHAYSDSMEIELSGKMVFMGNATFSKYKIAKTKTHVLSKEKGRIAIQTDIQINDVLIHVFNTHLTHAHLEESKIRDLQMEALLNVLPKEKTMVMGDFNALPESTTLQKIEKVLKNTDKNVSPTWSNFPEGCKGCKPQDLKYKLDYIFVSDDMKTDYFEVLNSKASDHLPVLAIIEI